MTNAWEPGTYYGPGSEVSYQGSRYKIIQPHNSQGDWTPNITPALWGRIGPDGEDCAHPKHDGYGAAPDSYEHPQGPPHPPAPNTGYTTHNGAEVGHEEANKKWYDIDDDRKQQLLTGGAIALGLGALAGGAFYVHEKHKEEGETEKAQAFEVQNWLRAAEQRTQEFMQNGPRSPATWVLFNAHNNVSRDLLRGGESNGQPLYIARAPHKGGLQVGKVQPPHPAIIGYGNEGVEVKMYEVLLGSAQGVRWVPSYGRLDLQGLSARPVEGGREADGTPLFVARAHTQKHSGLFGSSGEDGIIPGKVSPQHGGAMVVSGDKEIEVKEYEVLCYA